MKTYDAIVVGAGHNGLANAAYLAKSGLDVLCLEKNDYIGGATVSRNLHGDWLYSNCSYVCSLLRPEIRAAIKEICANPDYQINLDDYEPSLEPYAAIRSYASEEELLYQILLIQGDITLGHGPEHLYTAPSVVRKAKRIAESIRAQTR